MNAEISETIRVTIVDEISETIGATILGLGAEISETVGATILGLGTQIPEIPAQRKFDRFLSFLRSASLYQ